MEMKGNSFIPLIVIKPYKGLGTLLGAGKAAVNKTYIPGKRTGKADDWAFALGVAVLGQENLGSKLAHWRFFQSLMINCNSYLLCQPLFAMPCASLVGIIGPVLEM